MCMKKKKHIEIINNIQQYRAVPGPLWLVLAKPWGGKKTESYAHYISTKRISQVFT